VINPDFRMQRPKALKFRIDYHYHVDNLFRFKSGILHFRVPYQYETNSTDGSGGLIDMGGLFSEESLVIAQDRLKELLGLVTTDYPSKGELEKAMIYAVALRELSQVYELYKFCPHDIQLHRELNLRFGLTCFAFHACDELLNEVISCSRHHPKNPSD
jgi:hypothetical protein